ncbi:CHAT domain-containing protein [Chitinophaga sp. YR573]|uniref:CHAT domain-containing protein n=1 Tax=Chitinophaga sp. YR573 TaxID=1881040 RepID=UPI0008D17C2D|nr:CHAT domain-containing protein [Chitinophaga sp. YR573]SEW07341.1 CHAT domain-containing protein [Chitinophaga sp. YR573]
MQQIAIKGDKYIPGIVAPVSESGLWLQASYTISNSLRGAAVERHDISLDKNDLLEFVFSDDTTWLCGKDSLGDLFPETLSNRSATFEIPSSIKATGANRGLIEDIAIKVINHFIKTDIDDKVATIAAGMELKKLENKVGLFLLDTGFQLQPFSPGDEKTPYLLFLHGTASSTSGSFEGLKGKDEWTSICKTYGHNIIAFNHRSLTESPLQNALQLVQQLPEVATLHLISHSRGGLIGDILSRFCITDENNKGFSADEIALLENEGRTNDVSCIAAIKNALSGKKITVKKFIRVACPAAGTTLASSRMDLFFNVIGNLTGDLFKELIASVVNTKNDIHVLPGLEAMNPESPFIKVLNDVTFKGNIDAPLVVISGNCRVKLGLKALVIIASKLFYQKNNDLVVNTGAMYQGAKRSRDLQYFFDEGADVDHFSYFKNAATAKMLKLALDQQVDDTLIPGFTYMTRAQAITARGLESGQLFMDTVTGKRPIVLLLPGVMGSNLQSGNDLLWINYWSFATGGLLKLAAPDNITAPSIVATSYRKLAQFLSNTYDVVTFPYDWRRQLNECASLLNDKIKELLKYDQPIKIVAHSMGGVVVRDFIVTHADTWVTLNTSNNFQLIFLGAPLGGSFRIPYALFGKDPLIVKLGMLDILHTKKELIKVFCQWPGLLSLLPPDMGDTKIWDEMRIALGDDDWPVPIKDKLDEFNNYRKGINQTVIDYSNAVYIAGKDNATPYGYTIDDTGLIFLSTTEGDSNVTWESGIPSQMITADTVYYVNVTHGQLANNMEMFNGIVEILEKGQTSLLSKQRPVVRGIEKVFRTPDTQDFDLSPAGLENSISGNSDETPAVEASEVPVSVSVSQGDLLYATYPVLNGHFKGDGILYAEKAIDNYLEGALTKRHKLGLYPGVIGSSEILIASHLQLKGAVVVGLGEAGTLTAYQLSLTIEQGIANYLLFLESNNIYLATVGISSLIIGCGYGGLTIENSVRAILQGVQRANAKIRKLQGKNARVVSNVEFIEKYEDRALNAYYALHTLENENSRSFNIAIADKDIKTLLGLERRVSKDQSDDWWNRISVQLINREQDNDKIKCLQFSASTGGAREEQRQLFSSLDIITALISEISTSNEWSAESAKTVFELLIPNDFKEQFKKQANINWILDKNTAAYPWELLHDGLSDNYPLAVNAGMIRQLATKDYRLTINAVAKKTALIVADPQTKGFLPSLPAAFKEGQLVSEILDKEGFATTKMIQSSSFNVIKALFADDYKIIHLAGHGVFNKDNPEASGMVIGSKVYLSTREIAQMSTVPELVFVNCCSLGEADGVAEEFYRDRYQLAANIGIQLIENGVKAVVAAGWAVNDDAAYDFTEQFYTAMFEGYNFGLAIQKARKYIYDKYPDNNNTWGAYQCYGDPFYKLTDLSYNAPAAKTNFVMPQEADDALFNLLNKVQMGNRTVEEYLQKLDVISTAIDKADLRNAAITEKEALIYAELGEYDMAVAKFEQLLKAENAAFSFLATESYCNISSKKYMTDIIQYPDKAPDLLKKFESVVAYLKSLADMFGTAERFMLLGNSYKYNAMFATDRRAVLQQAADYYQSATAIDYSVYTVVSWKEIEILLSLIDGKKVAKDTSVVLNKFLQQASTPLDVFNIRLCLLLINPGINIEDAFLALSNIAGSPGKKRMVREHLQFLSDVLSWCKKTDPKDTIDKLIKDWV